MTSTVTNERVVMGDMDIAEQIITIDDNDDETVKEDVVTDDQDIFEDNGKDEIIIEEWWEPVHSTFLLAEHPENYLCEQRIVRIQDDTIMTNKSVDTELVATSDANM
jgi:hypothetical protein